jgi:membrane dipeptidase
MALNASAEALAIHQSALIVDLHCDLLLTSWFTGWDWSRRHAPNPLPKAWPFGHCDIPRLREGNLGCLALGVVTNPLWAGPRQVLHDLDRMHAEVARAPADLVHAGTVQGIRAARQQGKIAVFAGMEGVHPLGGRLEALPACRERGLRYAGLVHFSANAAGRPMIGWGGGRDGGLTDHGRDLVDELNRLRILVDVAHLNRAGVLEVCARSKAPVVCSHTACNAVHHSPRGIDDDLLRAIAGIGGVVGVIFVDRFIGDGGARQAARHLDHIKRTVGIAHCAIGTDWEGFAWYPADLDSADKLPKLTQALLDLGWTGDEILAAYGENALRVFADAW